MSDPAQDTSGVPSPDNPLLPQEPGYLYGSVLPFRAKESLAHPGQAMPGTTELALPDIIRSSINELTSAATLPGRTALGQVDMASLPQQAIKASLALMGSGVGVNSLTGEALGANVMGTVRGWHGTPHTFEPVEGNPFGAFKDEAIGSGEGNQVYGSGHYIAGNQATAESYRNTLVRSLDPTNSELQNYFKPGNIVPGYGGQDKVLSFNNENWSDGKPGKWSVTVQAVDKNGQPLPGERPRTHATAPTSGELKKAGVAEERGSLLNVEMKPEEHQFLDWDKPLGQQDPGVVSKIKSLIGMDSDSPLKQVTAARSVGYNGPSSMADLPGKAAEANKWLEETQGANLYHALAGKAKQAALAKDPQADVSNGKALISQYLHDNGIPGVKYADQGSRNLPPGSPKTNNYVVFHPSNLKITGRNGQTLEPVQHDPFAGPGHNQPPAEGPGFKAGPGKISTEHGQMMNDLYTQALKRLATGKGPSA